MGVPSVLPKYYVERTSKTHGEKVSLIGTMIGTTAVPIRKRRRKTLHTKRFTTA